VLINLDRVGGLGTRADDVLLLGDCDEGVRKLADALGWRDELEALWRETAPEGTAPYEKPKVPEDKDEAVAAEVDRLTRDIEESLKVSSAHHEKVTGELGRPSKMASPTEGAERAQVGLSDPGQREILTVPDDTSNGTLGHVYPHLDKKPSL
jgi:NAD-dependent histone deacetylase SIR2